MNWALACCRALILTSVLVPQAGAQLSPEVWKTDLSKRSIDLSELHADGPAKDGIPSIDAPRFEPVVEAAKWLVPGEPVVVIELGGEARAYPLQILLWHELVNDQIGDVPVLVSYCPLCNSAVVFDRRVNGQVHTFGVAGFLRHNDMVMYDRQTDTLWQQLTGEAISGTLTGRQLTPIASRLAPFDAFARSYAGGRVLNRETGYFPNYGQSAYEGYEFGDSPAGAGAKPVRKGAPFDRVLAVTAGGRRRGYGFAFLRRMGVVEDRLKDLNYVIFFSQEMLTPLDASRIAESRPVGTAAAYKVDVNGRRLRFRRREGRILDRETGSAWNILGLAIDGPLKGTQLKPVPQMIYFEFAHRAFFPRSEVVGVSTSANER